MQNIPCLGKETNDGSPTISCLKPKFPQDKGKSFAQCHSKAPGRAQQGFSGACCEKYFYRILKRA